MISWNKNLNQWQYEKNHVIGFGSTQNEAIKHYLETVRDLATTQLDMLAN